MPWRNWSCEVNSLKTSVREMYTEPGAYIAYLVAMIVSQSCYVQGGSQVCVCNPWSLGNPGPEPLVCCWFGSPIRTAPRFVREFRQKQKLDHALSAGMLSVGKKSDSTEPGHPRRKLVHHNLQAFRASTRAGTAEDKSMLSSSLQQENVENLSWNISACSAAPPDVSRVVMFVGLYTHVYTDIGGCSSARE